MAVEIVNWLEIPVTDMGRAKKFYESLFDFTIVELEVGSETYPCFPDKNGESFSGALVKYDFTRPGKEGPLVYLRASPDVETMLKRIISSGGKVIQERTEIAPGFGYYALFEDSEGNLLAIQGKK